MSKLKVYNSNNSNAIFCADDFYKVADVEPILNSHQQLKAEIAALLLWDKDTVGPSDAFRLHEFRNRLRQLSAV